MDETSKLIELGTNAEHAVDRFTLGGEPRGWQLHTQIDLERRSAHGAKD